MIASRRSMPGINRGVNWSPCFTAFIDCCTGHQLAEGDHQGCSVRGPRVTIRDKKQSNPSKYGNMHVDSWHINHPDSFSRLDQDPGEIRRNSILLLSSVVDPDPELLPGSRSGINHFGSTTLLLSNLFSFSFIYSRNFLTFHIVKNGSRNLSVGTVTFSNFQKFKSHT